MDDEPTYLQMLQHQLRDYEARRARATEMPDGEYRDKILAGWDHAIGVTRAMIEREEARRGNC